MEAGAPNALYLLRLQRLTAALSLSMSVPKIINATLRHLVSELGAVSGAAALSTRASGAIAALYRLDRPDGEIQVVESPSLDDATPLAETLRTGRPTIRDRALSPRAGAGPMSSTTISSPLSLGDRLLGALELRLAHGRLQEDDRLYIAQVTLLCAQAIDRTQLYVAEQAARIEAELARRHWALMAEVSKRLATSLEFEATVQQIATLAVPMLADWCSVDIITDDGVLQLAALAHRDTSKLAQARRMRELFPVRIDGPSQRARVFRTGQAELNADLTEDHLAMVASSSEHVRLLGQFDVVSSIVVPMRAQGKTIGVLSLASAESGRHYTALDLDVAEELARRSALAIDHAMLYEQSRVAVRAHAQLNSLLQQEIAARTRSLSAANAALHTLGDERDLLRQVLDVLPEGVVLIDSRGWMVTTNVASGAILPDAVPRDVAAHHARTFPMFHMDGTPYEEEELPLTRSLREGEVVRGEQLLAPNGAGEPVPLLFSSAPLRSVEGVLIGVVGVFQDISPIKEFERQKDQFLAAVSHDLRNPLMAVKGQVQLLQRRVARSETVDRGNVAGALGNIDVTVDKLTSMVNELLDATQLQMGQELRLDLDEVDLVALARQEVSLRAIATEKHRLVIESDEESLVGTWDAARLQRVLDNLLSNALKYSPQGGDIVVTIRRKDGGHGAVAELTVRDHGIGIPADDLPRVFEPFFRGTNVSRRTRGTGIGLAGVRRIIEQHGGHVSVESTVGAGATMTLQLPLNARCHGGSAAIGPGHA